MVGQPVTISEDGEDGSNLPRPPNQINLVCLHQYTLENLLRTFLFHSEFCVSKASGSLFQSPRPLIASFLSVCSILNAPFFFPGSAANDPFYHYPRFLWGSEYKVGLYVNTCCMYWIKLYSTFGIYQSD